MEQIARINASDRNQFTTYKQLELTQFQICHYNVDFACAYSGMLKWHMRRHELVGNELVSDVFTCNQCGKVFENRKGFLIHLKHMHKEPSPQVNDLKILFTSPTCFINMVVDPQNDFPCSTCKFRASTKVKLESHIYKCHTPNTAKPKFTCNICGFKTIYKGKLNSKLCIF